MKLDRATATRRLTNRWLEQVEMFPSMREDVPLKKYIRANLPSVLRSWRGIEALIEYNERG